MRLPVTLRGCPSNLMAMPLNSLWWISFPSISRGRGGRWGGGGASLSERRGEGGAGNHENPCQTKTGGVAESYGPGERGGI